MESNSLGTFTVEFNADDRARLDRLAELLGQFVPPTLESEPVKVKAVKEVEPVEPETVPEPVEEPEQPTYTAADIQAKVQKLASPACGKRNEVKALVREYAERVSLIPEDKYNEVMQRLTEIEGG